MSKGTPFSLFPASLPPDAFLSLMNGLPAAMQTALDEVERTTGMKSILLMGGPIPALDGKIGTHLYVMIEIFTVTNSSNHCRCHTISQRDS